MLKYIKNHMATMADIEWFPLISFVIFFVFFATVIVYAMIAKKPFIDKMSSLPLDDDAPVSLENA